MHGKRYYLLIAACAIACVISCNQRPATNSCNNSSDAIVRTPIYREQRYINDGDSVILTGGSNRYLSLTFGCDSCLVKVREFFYKDFGNIGSFRVCPGDSTQFYAVSLYYRNSKEGYDPGTLVKYPQDPHMVIENEDAEWTQYPETVDDSIIVIKYNRARLAATRIPDPPCPE